MSQPQSKPISAVARQKENNLEELKLNKSLGPDGSYPWVLEKIKEETFRATGRHHGKADKFQMEYRNR